MRGFVLALLCLTLLAETAQAQSRGGAADSARGTQTTPQSGDDDRSPDGPSPRGEDAATTSGGRFEFVTSGPQGQAAAASDALTQAGAVILRSRAFPALQRQTLVVDLRRLSLAQARQVLAGVAPQTQIDLHHFYRFAQSKPRLFAARMLGLPRPDACRVDGLRVRVIDGPIKPDHAAFAGTRVATHSVLRRGERGVSTHHGTGVAALISGEDPRGALTGFSPGVRLYAVSAFAQESRGAAADVERISAALDWLIGQQVRLVNMSFAGPTNRVLQDVLQAAARRGVVMVAAVGNGGSDLAFFPAAADAVISVTAVDAGGRLFRRANRGPHVEFAAPGVDLYVAKGRGGGYASGTSFAAPIVTALAAQAMQRGARSTGAVRAALRRGVQDLGAAGRDSRFGWGLVQAAPCR